MTDKEKLDEIISKHTNLDNDLSMEDKSWLIQEVSKLELLEEVNSALDGDYQFYKIESEKLEKEIKLRKQYESFLKSVIRSGEALSDTCTFEWFCEKAK